jgi:hypothetical protein
MATALEAMAPFPILTRRRPQDLPGGTCQGSPCQRRIYGKQVTSCFFPLFFIPVPDPRSNFISSLPYSSNRSQPASLPDPSNFIHAITILGHLTYAIIIRLFENSVTTGRRSCSRRCWISLAAPGLESDTMRWPEVEEEADVFPHVSE